MTILLETLKFILEWQQHNGTTAAERWKPGLSTSEIEALVKPLPFQLSREFYELYQWRNGGCLYFPLEVAVEVYDKMTALSEDDLSIVWNPYWLPITDGFNGGYPADELQSYRVIVGSKEVQDTSLLLDIDFESPEPGIWYPSVVNLMLATLEKYQTGLHLEDLEDAGYGPIHEKYNPGGDYLSIWDHKVEISERSDGSKVEIRYDPDTEMVSGIEIHSSTGKTKDLTYYYRGEPAYRTLHSYEKPDCYHYVRTEIWLGIHDAHETISVLCKEGWGSVATERRYIDRKLIQERNYPVD